MATTNTVNANVTVKFVVNEKGNPPGKLADAELHFNDGLLAGLKLIGFAVWERRSGGGRNVTFPARQYSVNGERRSFALLRPIDDVAAQAAIRDVILEAYAQFEASAVSAEQTRKGRLGAPLRHWPSAATRDLGISLLEAEAMRSISRRAVGTRRRSSAWALVCQLILRGGAIRQLLKGCRQLAIAP